MEIRGDVSLAPFNTLGLDVRARRLVTAVSREDVRDAARLARAEGWPLHVIGGGSNIVLTGDLPGLTLRLALRGRSLGGQRITAAAGEDWDSLVDFSVSAGACGLENLSAIPGTVGAAPVQNIGAYGVQLSDCFEGLQAYDRETDRFVRLGPGECGFGYRDSVFKSSARARFVICEVTLRMSATFRAVIAYPGVAERAGRNPTPEAVRGAIIAIRREKLPDPVRCPNVGSFFKNPVVSTARLTALHERYPRMPAWPEGDAHKLAAAWLIEQAGCKGAGCGGAAVSDLHALVIVNRGSATPADIARLTAEIQARVRENFGVGLEVEPDPLP